MLRVLYVLCVCPCLSVAGKAKELLKLRDVRQCELKKHAAAVGKAYLRKICPQTELPYGQCCGRNNRLAAKDIRRTKQQRLRML